jgi:hypothetical protein
MDKSSTYIEGNVGGHERDLDISPVPPPAAAIQHDAEVELAVLGTGERVGSIEGKTPRSKIRLAAILIALNVRRLERTRKYFIDKETALNVHLRPRSSPSPWRLTAFTYLKALRANLSDL